MGRVQLSRRPLGGAWERLETAARGAVVGPPGRGRAGLMAVTVAPWGADSEWGRGLAQVAADRSGVGWVGRGKGWRRLRELSSWARFDVDGAGPVVVALVNHH